MTGPGPAPIWPGPPQFVTSIGVSKLSTRLLAFLIDGIVLLVASALAYGLAGILGAWSLDSSWLNQYEANPDTFPSTPAFHVNLVLLLVASVAIAIAIVVFAALCWHRWGALPGQRALGVRVLDFETGKPLSLAAALGRSVALFGVIGAAASAYSLTTFERLATMSINDTSSELLPAGTPLEPWLDVISGLIFLASMWLLVLAVSTTADRQRRGVHDRIASGIVIAIRHEFPVWRPPYAGGPAPQPGWTPPGAWSPPGQQTQIPWSTAPLPPAPPPSTVDPTQTPWKKEVTESRRTESGEIASIGKRVVAYLFDSVLVLLLFVAAFSTLAPDGVLDGASVANERVAILAGLAGGAIQLVYFVLGWSLWKASVGQRMMGLSVVLESDGKAMSPMDALVRWAVVQGPFALVTIVPLSISPVVAVLAAGWSAFLLYSTQADANRQGIHDHFLKTKVVEA